KSDPQISEARAAADRIYGANGTTEERKLLFLEGCGQDAHRGVRLEAIRALAHFKLPAAVEAALTALDKPMDRVLDYALWLTVRELEPYWMPEFSGGKLTFGCDAKKLAFALNEVGNRDTVKPVLALINSGKVPKEHVHGLYLLLAQIGGPEELVKVLSYSVNEGVTAGRRMELVQAAEDAIRTRKV